MIEKLDEQNPVLKIHLAGDGVGPASVSTRLLVALISTLTLVVKHINTNIKSDSSNDEIGKSFQKPEIELDLILVSLSEGNENAVLGFEIANTDLSGTDRGIQTLERAVVGLKRAQTLGQNSKLPDGYNDRVLDAWLSARSLFTNGVESVTIELNGTSTDHKTKICNDVLDKLKTLRSVPENEECTIEGRLMMIDLHPAHSCFRVHPSVSPAIHCKLNDDIQEIATKNLDKFVRIVGSAEIDPISHTMKLTDVQQFKRLEIDESFWDDKSIDELNEEQQVSPIEDLSEITGTWPGEIDDGFEELIDRLRHPERHRDT